MRPILPPSNPVLTPSPTHPPSYALEFWQSLTDACALLCHMCLAVSQCLWVCQNTTPIWEGLALQFVYFQRASVLSLPALETICACVLHGPSAISLLLQYNCWSDVFVLCGFEVDFSVMVLSSVAWPFMQGPPFTVPVEVSYAHAWKHSEFHINHVMEMCSNYPCNKLNRPAKLQNLPRESPRVIQLFFSAVVAFNSLSCST